MSLHQALSTERNIQSNIYVIIINDKVSKVLLISAAFDMVNHKGTLYKLCSVGIGSSVLSIFTQFLSDRSQHVMVDGCRSKLVNAVSGVPQGSVLGPLLFLL